MAAIGSGSTRLAVLAGYRGASSVSSCTSARLNAVTIAEMGGLTIGDMKIELVVFDMAGTTVRDDDAVHTVCGRRSPREPRAVTRSEVNSVMGIPKPVAIRTLLERQGLEGRSEYDDTYRRDSTAFSRRMIAHYQQSATSTHAAHESGVQELRAAGVRSPSIRDSAE